MASGRHTKARALRRPAWSTQPDNPRGGTMRFTTPVIGPAAGAAVLLIAATAAGLAGCSSSTSSSSSAAGGSSSSAASGSALTVADVAPFSGPDAALGPTYLASCYGATTAINSDGGVMGHKL